MEAATLLERALDPAAAPPTDATSQRILDGALDAAAASGIKHLTIDEVARRAGVGRVTVYRKFGDRQRLVEVLGVREARRCLAVIEESSALDQPLDEQIAEAFVAGLRMLREHPLLSRLVAHEPDVLLDSLTNQRTGLFPYIRAYVAGRIAAAEAAGASPRTDLDQLQIAEAFVRMTASFALMPDTVLPLDDEAEARETARRLIAPIVSG